MRTNLYTLLLNLILLFLGELVIEEVQPEQVVHHDQPEETVLAEEVVDKQKEENTQIVQEHENRTEETPKKPAIETETIIIQSVDNCQQIETQHITIIDAGDSIDFTTGTIIEEVDQTFSSVGESFPHDESMSQDSSVTEELIIIQEVDSEENPDDPAPEPQTPDQSSTQEGAQSKPKGRKGRKSTFDIPMHVLGHDINKPLEPVVNGRAIPKPRLGVKVPYRNLTSQIVSKAEIEKEIMERGRLKMEQSKDQTFARSLTQRLARKIAPTSDSAEGSILSVMEQKDQKPKIKEEKKAVAATVTSVSEQTSIQNDSDLLAILEGDGDEADVPPVVQKEPSNSPQVSVFFFLDNMSICGT